MKSFFIYIFGFPSSLTICAYFVSLSFGRGNGGGGKLLYCYAFFCSHGNDIKSAGMTEEGMYAFYLLFRNDKKEITWQKVFSVLPLLQ
jgi:hypothetical protein